MTAQTAAKDKDSHRGSVMVDSPTKLTRMDSKQSPDKESQVEASPQVATPTPSQLPRPSTLSTATKPEGGGGSGGNVKVFCRFRPLN